LRNPKNRGEIEALFTLKELKQTKFYQEAWEEGRQEGLEEVRQEMKLALVPELWKEGLTLEQIARIVKLPIEIVQKAIENAEE
jgi:predicted transposase/invertase (TIGR01784 family)